MRPRANHKENCADAVFTVINIVSFFFFFFLSMFTSAVAFWRERLVGWSVGWLVGWSTGWLVGWMGGWVGEWIQIQIWGLGVVFRTVLAPLLCKRNDNIYYGVSVSIWETVTKSQNL